MVRVGAESDRSHACTNREERLGTAPQYEVSRCIASACMAWRWSRAKETQAYLDAVQSRMKESGENFNVATQKVYADVGSTFEQVEGYCGAFGKDGAP